MRVTVGGVAYEVTFTRRRYGSTTYTWAYVQVGAQRLPLGDPWPGVNWPRKELTSEVARVVAEEVNR